MIENLPDMEIVAGKNAESSNAEGDTQTGVIDFVGKALFLDLQSRSVARSRVIWIDEIDRPTVSNEIFPNARCFDDVNHRDEVAAENPAIRIV